MGSGGGVTYLHRSRAQDLSWASSTVIHELHHALLGILHPFGAGGPTGLTAVESGRKTSLTYNNDPNLFRPWIERENLDSGHNQYRFVGEPGALEQGISRVLSCGDRERLGWPTGPGTPVCAKLSDVDLRATEVDVTFVRGGTMSVAAGTYDQKIQVEEMAYQQVGPATVYGDLNVSEFRILYKLLEEKVLESGGGSAEFLLESGSVYRLRVTPFDDNGPGIGIERHVTAMAMPDEVEVSPVNWTTLTANESGEPRWSRWVEWPAAPNAVGYPILGTRGYEWVGNAPEHKSEQDDTEYLTRTEIYHTSGYTSVHDNFVQLSEPVHGIRPNTPVELRIDVCHTPVIQEEYDYEGAGWVVAGNVGTTSETPPELCAPYARVTLPAIDPNERPGPPEDWDPDNSPSEDWDPDNSPSNVRIIDTSVTSLPGETPSAEVELAWDAVPGADTYSISISIDDPDASTLDHDRTASTWAFIWLSEINSVALVTGWVTTAGDATVSSWHSENNSVTLGNLWPGTRYEVAVQGCLQFNDDGGIWQQCGDKETRLTFRTPAA